MASLVSHFCFVFVSFLFHFISFLLHFKRNSYLSYTNSVDPDQTPLFAASNQNLHYLPKFFYVTLGTNGLTLVFPIPHTPLGENLWTSSPESTYTYRLLKTLIYVIGYSSTTVWGKAVHLAVAGDVFDGVFLCCPFSHEVS